MTWYRLARVVGLSSQPEYPNVAALMEAEAGLPYSGFFYAARIVPPIAFLIAAGVFVPLALNFSGLFHIGTVAFSVLGVALWFIFDYFDRAIPPAKKRIRQLAKQLWGRYGVFGHTAGQPVLPPTVGPVVDEAAAIYLKHSQISGGQNGPTSEAYRKTFQALEVAMGRMMELATAPSPQIQGEDLAWALPLLQEMREADKALTRSRQSGRADSLAIDPLSNLRNAHSELSGIVSAISELEQSQSQ